MSRDRRRLENQKTFRAANEKQRERAGALVDAGDPVPCLCECADARCTQVLLLTLDTYREVRAEGGGRFLIAPNHELVEREFVVSREERFWVTEKPDLVQEDDSVAHHGSSGG
jgi:hypothetical protein